MKFTRRLRIRQRFLIYVTLGFVLFFSGAGFTAYQALSNLLLQNVKEDAMVLAQNAARDINGERYASITASDDEYFQEVYDILSEYQSFSSLQYIYTMNYDSNTLYFVVDADPVDPAPYMEEYNWNDSMEPAFNGQACTDNYVTTDEWGSYYSAYAPIFTKEGTVVGIVGVDFSVDPINANLRRLKSVLVILVFSIVVLASLAYTLLNLRLNGIDDLTELPRNPRLMKKGELLKKKKKLHHYTAIQVNIKDFKYINKQYSYAAGNVLLRELAATIKGMLKRKDYVARTGNDNFLILVENDRAFSVMQQFANGMTIPIRLTDGVIKLNVAFRCGGYPITEEDDIASATNKCYVALRNARNTVKTDAVWFSESMYDSLSKEKEVLTGFQSAMDKKEFKVFYQPKVNTKKERLCGAEALVRWQKPSGMISPGLFIPVLEKEGLITELDFYVFKTVCEDIKRWESEGLEPVRISTNFSRLHLDRPEFADRILSIADYLGVSHELLEIEITESTSYTDLNALNTFITRMKEEGIRVSMDDFGTGYSSLSLLGDLDFDVIKLDKSFIDRISDNSKNGAKLVGNTINMINDLGKEVVCEGVEENSQILYLSNTDCNVIQGYFFDRPLPVDEFEKRLLKPTYEILSINRA